MPIYTDEISIYNADAIEQAIGDSRDYYITEITGDGIWVTPHDARPSNGQATSTTRGWHIANALEYFRGTVRYIKAWLNGTVPTVRLGQDTAGHADVTPSGLEVFAGTNGADSMAKFGSETRIGKSNGARFVTNASSLQAYDSNDNMYFEVSADGLYYGSTRAADHNALSTLENYVRGMTYFATEDSTAQEGKTYYTRTTVTVYGVSDATPGMSASGLYERSNGTYVATSDSVVKAGKTYYEADTDYEYTPFEVNVGGSVTGKYEGTNGGSIAGSIDENTKLIGQVSEKNLELENRTFGEGGLSENVSAIGSELRSAVYIDPVNATVSVGYMDTNRTFMNSHTEVNSSGFDVYYGEALVGHYGSTISLGDVSGTHMVASGDHMGFVDSTGNEVAYIDIDDNGESVFYMTRSVVVQDMFFGDGMWKFYKRDNNNMSLKWMGGD